MSKRATAAPLAVAELLSLAQQVYDEIAPSLRVHVVCRTGGTILISVCRARGIDATLHYAERHRDAGGGPHYWCQLADGTCLDLSADRKFRILPPGRRHAA